MNTATNTIVRSASCNPLRIAFATAGGTTVSWVFPSRPTPFKLTNIADLITYGEITVGVLDPVGCVAVATDGHNSLAMLVRRQDETLAELLARLDQAIDKALTEDIYTDEIN